MINIFNRREVLISRSLEELNRVCDRLALENIKYIVKTNNLTNPGRQHGIPNIRSDSAYEYRVYVHAKDYDRGVYAVKQK